MKKIPAKIISGQIKFLEISAYDAIYHAVVNRATKHGIFARYYMKFQFLNGKKIAVNSNFKPEGFFAVEKIKSLKEIAAFS